MGCGFCGGELPSRNRVGRPKKYCDERCRREADKASLKTYTCRICGKEFLSPWRAWYCSDQCKALRPCKIKRTQRTCKICGGSFEPKSSNQSCCGLACAHLASGDSQRKRSAVCLFCGRTWNPRQTLGRRNQPIVFCCREHYMLHLRENGLALHRSLVRKAQQALGGPDLSPGDVNSRSIKSSLRSRVLERDGLMCQECGRELHDIKNRLDDRKATVDHIVPRCLGGGDDEANLRCLCHRCNSAQGKTYGGLLAPAPEYLRGYAPQTSRI